MKLRAIIKLQSFHPTNEVQSIQQHRKIYHFMNCIANNMILYLMWTGICIMNSDSEFDKCWHCCFGFGWVTYVQSWLKFTNNNLDVGSPPWLARFMRPVKPVWKELYTYSVLFVELKEINCLIWAFTSSLPCFRFSADSPLRRSYSSYVTTHLICQFDVWHHPRYGFINSYTIRKMAPQDWRKN